MHLATAALGAALPLLWAACASSSESKLELADEALRGKPEFENATAPGSARLYFLPFQTRVVDDTVAGREASYGHEFHLVIDGARVGPREWARDTLAGGAVWSGASASPGPEPVRDGLYSSWRRQKSLRYVEVAPGTHRLEIHWREFRIRRPIAPWAGSESSVHRSGAISTSTAELAPNRVYLLAPWIDRSPPDSTGCPTCVQPGLFTLGSMADGIRALTGPGAIEVEGPAEWRRAVYEASVALEKTHP